MDETDRCQPGWRFRRALLDEVDRRYHDSRAGGYGGSKSDYVEAVLRAGLDGLLLGLPSAASDA